MDVARREKFSLTCGDPALPSSGLTLRAVAVAAGVVGDGAMPAARALVEMPAKGSSATPPNGQKHLDVLPANPVAAPFDECVACDADEIGHLQRWPAHLFVPVLFVFQLQRIQRTRSRMEVAIGKMQVHGGLFQIAMAQQNLNRADMRARFEEMRGEAVAQSVRVQIFLDARSLSGFLARIPNRFRVDRPITAMVAVARKQPYASLSSQPGPVLAELLEQLWTEQHIAIFAPLATLDVNHHAFAVHIADFQARQLGAPQSRGVEHHQQGVMVGSERRINELRDFFRA